MIDSFKHQAKRRFLVEELRTLGITNEKVLDAFDKVPRHFFLDLVFEQQAYSNVAFQIG
ncbi:MAG: protein-L-isoaspartate O-methyltransferase, partial [Crocinitomicaceae bacterium]|nr:protein-L-isoaspartate O-methyltransferase [Crocinitomicaceae bacterium]